MAKKIFKSGIDALIQLNEESREEIGKNNLNDDAKTSGIHITVPANLKRRIDIYCAENGIKKKDFLIGAIKKSLPQ